VLTTHPSRQIGSFNTATAVYRDLCTCLLVSTIQSQGTVWASVPPTSDLLHSSFSGASFNTSRVKPPSRPVAKPSPSPSPVSRPISVTVMALQNCECCQVFARSDLFSIPLFRHAHLYILGKDLVISYICGYHVSKIYCILQIVFKS
jgi:hypothetical protein